MHGRKLALYTEAGPNRLALYTDRLLNPYIQRQGHTGSLCIYTYIYRCFGNSKTSLLMTKNDLYVGTHFL